MLYKNNNGLTYEVIARGCDKNGVPCALLKSKGGRWVCAWSWYMDRGEWGQGHYFMENEEGAREFFKENYFFGGVR